MKWVPDRRTRALGPSYPGEFIGQTFDDLTGDWGGRPFVLSQMEKIRRPLRVPERTGLAGGHVMERFTGKVAKISAAKGRLTFEQMGKLLSQAANVELNLVGGPAVDFSVPKTPTTESGSFSESRWALSLTQPQGAFSLSDLSDTVFHETRHAEQFFRVARLLAGFGLDSRQIVRETGIPRRIANSAALVPLRLPPRGWTPETAEAMRWYHAFFGEGSGHRFTTLWRYQRPVKDFLLAQAELQGLKAAYDSYKMLADGAKFDVAMLNDDIKFLDQEILVLEGSGNEAAKELAEKRLERQLKVQEQQKAIREYRENLQVGNRVAEAFRTLKAKLPDLLRRAEEAQELYYDDYRELPEEEDAWAAGTEIARRTRNL